MTVKQALKLKNKLIKKINEELNKVHMYNSIEKGNVRPYSTVESINLIGKLTTELIELKTKIHLANAPVYEKIFRLSELKSLASKYKAIDCTEGTSNDIYSRRSENTIIKESEISIIQRDEIVKELENEIELLQDQLDSHNNITKIK